MEGIEDMLEGQSMMLKGAGRVSPNVTPVTSVKADPRRELICAGTALGDITTLRADTLERYAYWNPASFATNMKDKMSSQSSLFPAIIDMTPVGTNASIGSCTRHVISVSDIGGYNRYSKKVSSIDCKPHVLRGKAQPSTCTCIEATFPSSSTVCAGHAEGAVTLIDFARQGEIVSCCWPDSSYQYDGSDLISPGSSNMCNGVYCVEPYRRGVICGMNTSKGGSIVFTDFRNRNLNAITTLTCFNGAVSCIKTFGSNKDMVAVCGFSKSRYDHGKSLVRDPYIKLFDMRYNIRLVNQVSCGHAPLTLMYNPASSGEHLLTLSELGTVTTMDIQAGHGTVVEQFQLEMDPYIHESRTQFTAGDVSLSGNVLLFGDSIGNVQLWGHEEDDQLNMLAEPLTEPTDSSMSTCSTYSMSEDGPFAIVPLYNAQDALLSDYEMQESMTVGLAPRLLHQSVLRDMSVVDNKLSVIRITKDNENILKRLNDRLRNPNAQSSYKMHTTLQKAEAYQTRVFIPGKYLHKQIKTTGQHEKFTEFDFKFYNTTRFAGLENNLPNCYCNALLQALFFTYPFCKELLECTPDSKIEFCLRDELAFLMHMLSQAHTEYPCQAQNMLLALMQSEDALNVGVLSSTMDTQIGRSTREIEADVNKEQSLFRRIQTLYRFLTESLHKEELELKGVKASTSSIQTIASRVFGYTNSVRNKCAKQHLAVKDSIYFQLNLQFPRGKAASVTFIDLVQNALVSETNLRAWCQSCKKYTPMNQRRIVSSMPRVLALNCNIRDFSELKYFATAENKSPWLKTKFYLKYDQKGESMLVKEDGAADDKGANWIEYELTALISMVIDDRGREDQIDEINSIDKITDTIGHFVAHVKVQPVYQSVNKGSNNEDDSSEWVLFNDFCVNPTSEKDVMQMYGHRKVPCMLFYTRKEILSTEREFVKSHAVLDKENFHRLCVLNSLSSSKYVSSTFVPLDLKTESPLAGHIFGIDSEFVALSKPEKKLHADGSETIVKQARLVLGRVSVVRGYGPKKGTCCIDDYVRAVEPIYDYLTRYSGLREGDLDVSRSKHHLTTLKQTYMKLRYMVDQGVHFVGHGLKTDFKMINITVPHEQIIDTVELFRLKNQRMLSLRFLAAYLLNKDIQGETHDSIEDANIALELYDVYCKLRDSKELNAKLLEMYRWGKQNKWDTAKASTLNL